MARVKISEFRAKTILAQAFGFEYAGMEVDLNAVPDAIPEGSYAVKVDQAVKKRNKLGLVKLGRNEHEVLQDLAEFREQGYNFALVEPMSQHDREQERFIALDRSDKGVTIAYSNKGGVDIEENADSLQHVTVGEAGWQQKFDDLNPEILNKLIEVFEADQMAYLEVNPFIVAENPLFIPLDAAIEVDSAAEFVVRDWQRSDIRNAKMIKSPSEKLVEDLQANSNASLTLRVLNPNGSLFLLLSGGGASVVLADELAHKGLANELANYGEYSGNPNDQETYQYTRAIIDLLKASTAPRKTLLIAGGVANFTDVAKTFKGITAALKQEAEYLKQNNVGVYVRRGGPNQEAGLEQMRSFLDSLGVKHFVYGPDVSLADFINRVAEELQA